jgi:hypothetical protein
LAHREAPAPVASLREQTALLSDFQQLSADLRVRLKLPTRNSSPTLHLRAQQHQLHHHYAVLINFGSVTIKLYRQFRFWCHVLLAAAVCSATAAG